MQLHRHGELSHRGPDRASNPCTTQRGWLPGPAIFHCICNVSEQRLSASRGALSFPTITRSMANAGGRAQAAWLQADAALMQAPSVRDTETHGHRDIEITRHTDTHTHRHTDTQTHRHRHTDTQTHRHIDTQTHRHTDTQTRRHTDTS
jgi:hypothetical protein